MPCNKSNQPRKISSAKKLSSQRQKQNNSNYQTLFLWVNFLWSLISLGMISQRVGVLAQGLPATLDLASLMASEGMLIEGAVAGAQAGISVSNAGDVNGDGKNDFLVGANGASSLGRSYAGAVYLIYGSASLPAVLDLNALNTSHGMLIQGVAADNQIGASVSGAGDVNGDGLNDLVIGNYVLSPLSRLDAGGAYLIYGSKMLPPVLDLNLLNLTLGMVIQGAMPDDEVGNSVSGAGDVNGDGLSDLVIGARYLSRLKQTSPGGAYLIYGSRALPASLDLNNITTLQSMFIQGSIAGDNLGTSVSGAGDVNGDGNSDILIGAWTASPLNRSYAGAVYLIYGSKNLPAILDLNTLNVSQGTVIQGVGGQVGIAVSGAGDVNGDNISDVLVVAPYVYPAGAAYLIFGSKTLGAALDLNSLNATQGMVIQGGMAIDTPGYSVASAGDVNGNGFADFLVGANAALPLNRTNAGAAYLIYGSKHLPATLDLDTLNLSQGLVIQGAMAGDETGWSVSSTEDVNGDGRNDILIGAYMASPQNRSAAGKAYLIYGKAAFNTMQTTLLTLPAAVITASSHSGTTNNLTNSVATEPSTHDTQAGVTSGNTGTLIGAAVGASIFGLAACLGAIGFYSYRKKSKATKAELNKSNVALQDKTNVSEQEHRIVSPQSDYGKIDEMKKTEKEYDYPPQFMRHEATNAHPDYGKIDETKKTENEYDCPTKLEIYS
jgi:hypothetical protein